MLTFGWMGAVVESSLGLLPKLSETPLQLAISGIASNLLPIGLLSTLLDAITPEISPVEFIGWSWKAIAENLRESLPLGCCFGSVVVLDLFATLIPSRALLVAITEAMGGGIIFAFIGGLIVVIINGLASGLPGGRLDERAFVVPNQGIRRSLRNSIVIGLLSWLVISVISELIITLIAWPAIGWLQGLRVAVIYAVLLGLLGGVAVGMVRGGIACIKHFALRVILRSQNFAPFDYPRFLHFVSDCNLLYRVGAGYTFFHPLLQDYLASQADSYFPDLGSVHSTEDSINQGQDGQKATSRPGSTKNRLARHKSKSHKK